jgi:thiamine-monophosphate kinase
VKKLSDLGERKAIECITQILSKGNIAVGPGDDCAAIEFGDEYLLITTDMVSEKTHIPKQMTPSQLGWFIVAINLSDIAAKGGKPLGLVLSFGMPKDTTQEFLEEVTKGANKCARKFGTYIVGGDMKEASDLFLCGTAFGRVKKDEFMSRKGAKPGDVVAVTGKLGRAAAGYYALKNNMQDEEIMKGLVEPFPRLDEGRKLAVVKIVTSCMDISDGLSSSLYQLKDLNNIGFEIEQEKIPISKEVLDLQKQINLDVYESVLHFGGDYELLITIPPDKFEKAVSSVKKVGISLTNIGKVVEKNAIIIVANSRKKILENKGYEHFKSHDF